jgi:hypothetical protein
VISEWHFPENDWLFFLAGYAGGNTVPIRTQMSTRFSDSEGSIQGDHACENITFSRICRRLKTDMAMFKGKRGKFLGIHHFLPAANEKTTGLFSQTKGWRQGFVSEDPDGRSLKGALRSGNLSSKTFDGGHRKSLWGVIVPIPLTCISPGVTLPLNVA